MFFIVPRKGGGGAFICWAMAGRGWVGERGRFLWVVGEGEEACEGFWGVVCCVVAGLSHAEGRMSVPTDWLPSPTR